MRQRIRATARLGWAASALLFAFTALQAQGEAFRFRGLLSRVITPNGDNLNDNAIFCLDNPADSEVSVRIYSLSGSKVADLAAGTGLSATAVPNDCPKDSILPSSGPRYVVWDGRSGGQVVAGGVYVYSVKAEGLNFTGSLVVVR